MNRGIAKRLMSLLLCVALMASALGAALAESQSGYRECSMRAAIVEDSPRDKEALISGLQRYAGENGLAIQTDVFANAENFLENYKAVYDVVFMDIILPGMTGIPP